MENMSFQKFVGVCKDIAKNLQTTCEVKKFTKYGWAEITFKVDNFGGTFACLHYDLCTNKIVNWYGEKDEREIKSVSFLPDFIKKEMRKELKERNIEAVYEKINEEY